MNTAPVTLEARRVRVTGLVQGVGFRPFVHRLAIRCGLAGSVRNLGGEVEIALEGRGEALEEFVGALRGEAPVLARIEAVEVLDAQVTHCEGFTIAPSAEVPGRREPVSPDVAICTACLAELYRPSDRRYHYPFITCTDCGPRFTVIEAMPYDRERTSMRAFRQCPDCLAEYLSPGNRRYHSETNSCPTCGPRLWFEGTNGEIVLDSSGAAIDRAAALVRGGGILALRALGGFQLAVDATSDRAVVRLRGRKHRPSKPFAIMSPTLAEIRALALVSAEAAELLASAARPIVLVPLRPNGPLASAVAPGLDTIGVMLPSTPLHHLLLEGIRGPVVMTSGNLTDEPIATGNAEARVRLGDVADGFLLHDREIVARYDDSVQRIAGNAPLMIRRARGYAPLPLTLPTPSPTPLLAVGPDLKNTFALVSGSRAYLSQHIGDLDDLETQHHFMEALDRFRHLFQIEPRVAVRDLHPGYRSTRIAEELGLDRIIGVQHHHAHIAAVLAEHGATGPVIGLAFDGTGYGDDGEVWGAEILHASLSGYRRIGHLKYAPLPGGDLAARQPWRAALGYLSLQPDHKAAFALAFEGVSPTEHAMASMQISRRLNTPLASSMGRLFDAASAVLGLRRKSEYEGQAAMELEARAGSRHGQVLPFPIEETRAGIFQLDPVPLLAELGTRRQRGEEVGELAATFHASLIEAAVQVTLLACEATGATAVALSGGVFQNARLMALLPPQLEAHGLRVLLPRALSPNDGCISFGQAAVAAALLDSEARASHIPGGHH